jgi:hypothetical protein
MGERLRKTMPDGAGLTGKAAAGDGGADVVLIHALGGNKRLLQNHLEDRAGEVRRDILVVDRDLAVAAGNPHARNGVLALARGIGAALGIELLDVQRRGSRIGSLAGEVSKILERLGICGQGVRLSCSCD